MLLACLCVLLLAAPAADPAPRDYAAAAIVDAPDYLGARWGVLFADAKTGEAVFARHPDALCVPASVTKVFSGGAAFVALGPDHRTTTPVFRRGEVTRGVLDGDLILVAKGDLTLGGRRDAAGKTAFQDNDHIYADGTGTGAKLTDTDPLAGLKSLAKQVRAAGITRVKGNVFVDDRLFAATSSSGSGPRAVSPVVVNDNVIDVTVSPGAKPGDPATAVARPATSYLRMDARVTTGGLLTRVRLTEPNGEDAQNYTLRGSVPVFGKPVVTLVGIERPAEFARTLFVECLNAGGVAVDAPVLAPNVTAGLPDPKAGYEKLPRVAAFESEPFKDVLKVTLKVSHNLYASTFPMLLAAKAGKTTPADGMHAQRDALKSLGVPVERISFGGGAGGSNADHVTARATVDLLLALRKRPDWPAFKDCLPVLGVDGTLAGIGTPNHPAKGHVFAKTGTVYWQDLLNDRTYLTSKALAGCMVTKSGRELVFAAFVNDVPLPKGTPTKREGQTLGRLCEAVYDAE